MKLKGIYLSLVCLALMTSCSSNKPAEKQAAVKPSVLETLTGTWVAEKYLTAIKTNKTPFVDEPESITFSAADKKLTWTNFHEGFSQTIFEAGQESNLYFLNVTAPETAEPPTKKVHFSLLDKTIIFLEPGITKRTNERFVKINEPLPQHANKLLLAGKYKDSEGNIYEFSEDGQAKWPTMSFTYSFVLDRSEANCPYINTNIQNGSGEVVRFGYK
ncbi:MAG TPA: hypothetical protein PKD17_09255, partial [Cellvibrionaceae bacterium]|nr:hypothetical protein [Cellvibrionaceae bacterium]